MRKPDTAISLPIKNVICYYKIYKSKKCNSETKGKEMKTTLNKKLPYLLLAFSVLNSVAHSAIMVTPQDITPTMGLNSNAFKDVLTNNDIKKIRFTKAYILGVLKNNQKFTFNVLPQMVQTQKKYTKFAISNKYSLNKIDFIIHKKCKLTNLKSDANLNHRHKLYIMKPEITVEFNIGKKSYRLQYNYKP